MIFVESRRIFEYYVGHDTIDCMANTLLRVQSLLPVDQEHPPDNF